MIQKYILNTTTEFDSKFIEEYLVLLPDFLLQKINSYALIGKKMQRIMGLRLIEKMIIENNLDKYKYNLNNLKISEFGKPYFNETLDFSLSYSEDFAVLGFYKNGKIGVDIEAIKAIDLLIIKDYCAENEFQQLSKSSDLDSDFCKLWTRKEAFSKAIGKGLFFDFSLIDTTENTLFYEGINWNIESKLFENKYWISSAHSV